MSDLCEETPLLQQMVYDAEGLFLKEFGCKPDVAVYAPGRVNIIGEHTDYNDGFVLPMALPLITVICAKVTNTGKVRLATGGRIAESRLSANSALFVEFPVPELKNDEVVFLDVKWANYVKGVIMNYKQHIGSFDAAILSSVPIGGGLSSSAALEVATYTALEQMFPPAGPITPLEKALACVEAEHVYAKMPCGIMDQFVSVMGQENHLLLIDCENMRTKLVPFQNPQVVVLITNSNVHHELSSSEYPLRKAQCYEAAQAIGKASLRQCTSEELDKATMSEVARKRARHVITETNRVEQAITALEKTDFTKLGQLMNQSHASLRDDFEVSCPEVDLLVKVAQAQPGVYGARMTGGGFGGCTVTLVKLIHVEAVMSKIYAEYQTETRRPSFFICNPSNGTGVIYPAK